MNVCLLTKTTLAHGLGGVEVHVETLSKTVPKLGHQLTIIASRHPRGITYEERNGCPTHYLPKTPAALYCRPLWQESAKKFIELHQQKPFDIIWAEDFAGYYYAWKLKSTIQVPILSIMQGSDLRGSIKSEWNRVNSILELTEFLLKFLPEALLRYYFWYKRVLKYSDKIVTVSHETAHLFEGQVGTSSKVEAILNGIDTNYFSPNTVLRERTRRQCSIEDSTRLLLMAAVVHKQKGMHVGIRAFKKIKEKFPNSKMMIVGDGEHLNFLKELTAQLGLGKDVIFCGAAPNEEMPAYYNACDLFLNSTLRWEGLPITTLEAMSCGKPIVISKISGTQSTIEDGVSGFFVEINDVEMIASKSLQILNEPGLAERMGQNARQRAVSIFSSTRMAQDYLALSEKLVNHWSSVAKSRARSVCSKVDNPCA